MRSKIEERACVIDVAYTAHGEKGKDQDKPGSDKLCAEAESAEAERRKGTGTRAQIRAS